jgi:PAS domain S-box-containing protein
MVGAGLIWRSAKLRELSLPPILPDILISVYLVSQGILSICHSYHYLTILDDKFPALLLLFMPAAFSASEAKTARQAHWSHPSTSLWLGLGMAIVGYGVALYSSELNLRVISPSIFSAVFLLFSMFYFGGIKRLLLGLVAAVWIIYFSGLSTLGASGIGILMGSISFSIIVSLTHAPPIAAFDFDLRDFIKSISDPYLVIELIGTVNYVNDAFLDISGYTRPEIIGRDAIDLFDIPFDWRFKLESPDRSKRARCHLVARGGERIPIRLSLSEIRNPGGEIKGLLCLLYDDRERETLEVRLKIESQKLAGFYETSQALASSLELKDVLRSIGRAAEKLTASDSCIIFSLDPGRQKVKPIYSSEEEFNAEVMNFEIGVGQGLTGAVVADGKPRIQNYDDEMNLAVHIPGTTEEEEESLLCMPLVAKNATIGAITLYKVGKRKYDEDDLRSLTVFAAQAAAIIEMSRLYMQLRSSEKLYRHSVDLAGDAILFVDFETGKITNANEMALKLFKYTRPELIAMRIWELNPEDQMQVAKRLWEEVKQTGWGRLGEAIYLARDGTPLPASVTVSAIYTGDANFIQWMVRDISDYKRSIERLGFFHQVFEKLGEPILITSGKGKILYSNKSFDRLFDIDEQDPAAFSDVAAIGAVGSKLDILAGLWADLKNREQIVDEVTIESPGAPAVKKTVLIQALRNSKGEPRFYIWFFHPPVDSNILGQTEDLTRV